MYMKKKEELIDGFKDHAKFKYSEGFPEGEVKEVVIFSGEELRFTSRANKVIFIVRGQVQCDVEGYPSYILQNRSLFFMCLGIQCLIKAQKDSKLILMWPGSAAAKRDSVAQAYICGVMANTIQKDLLKQADNQLPVLPFNTYIHHFTVGLLSWMSYGAQNEFYTSVKIREFFFLVGISYSEKDRIRFFESLNTAEQSFAAFIYRNYKQASSVKELADMACYSLSGFEKRFRKIFAQSASQWIAKRKAQMIYAEICDTSKPFKQLSHEYGFFYQAHFTRFCRKHLGYAPSIIRENHNIKDKNTEITHPLL